MNELIINLHIHTTFSDGSGSHEDLAQAALKTGVDVLLVTDHNILLHGFDAYYQKEGKKVLVLSCEEIHDQDRVPQKNHLLVFGVNQDLAAKADDPQALIDAVHADGGICFIAHPVDPAMPDFNEPDISWVDWNVTGFTGIELWNGFSEMKSVAKSKLQAILYGFFPKYLPHGPLPDTLRRWDSLTNAGRHIVAVGGSDAHAHKMTLGPIRKVIFPYEYHFSTINTHVLATSGLTSNIENDQKMVLKALADGHCFIGNDLPAPTRGFSFYVQGSNEDVIMGDEIIGIHPLTLKADLPSPAHILLIKDGKIVKDLWGQSLIFPTNGPGVYRIEAYKRFLGKMRGWIFSNPIYVR
jgi:hypothetical protein